VQLAAIDQPRLAVVRATDGSLPLLAAFASDKPGVNTAPAQAPSGSGWSWTLARVELNGGSVAVRDETVKPAAALTVDDIDAAVEGLSQDLGAKLPVKLALKVKEGGSLSADGTLVPAKGALDADLDLIGLNLTPVQPYIGQFVKLKLVSGTLGSRGHLTLGDEIGYRGVFRVSDLLVNESDTGHRFLAWRNLTGAGLNASSKGVNIAELRLDRLGAKLLIHKDKSTNFADIMKAKTVPAPSPAADTAKAPTTPKTAAMIEPEAAKAKPKQTGQRDAFQLGIEQVKVRNSEMDFADESLVLPFATHIHGLKGHINGISNRSGQPAQLELDGLVDQYGLARAAGKIDFLDPTGFTDVKVMFKNVEMTRLTPYSATFAGRKIASGKLSLNLEYKIKDRQLEGDNQVIMDQLTLGERVESPTAKNLPLDLAIAILQDSDGRIDLGLPVSGSLDDPQFSYGRIIWKAIVNLIGKIATAPFKALGSLFGGGGEKLEAVVFDAGKSDLLPPEKEKLKKVVQVLDKRPKLALAVQGGWSPEVDGLAIRDLRVRHALAETMGVKLEAGEDPGPLDPSQAKVRDALRKLYAKRFGPDALKAFESKFEQANPAPPPTSAAGRLLSGLGGLVKGKPAPVSAEELARMKGTDPGTLLYKALVDKERVTDADLAALGKARGEAMMVELTALAAPAGRVELKPAEAVAGVSGAEVPIKLGLGVAASAAPAPAATAKPTPAH
jgi:hypothetical protein